jgi:ABC-type glycerol-3-phosphate transport system substrate-binding protein
MNRLRQWSAAVVAGLVLAASLVGCGGTDESAKTLHVTRNIGGREGFRRHFEAWKARFEKANPGWKMELIDLGNAEGEQYYKSRIATGDLPEVIMTWQLTNFLADGGHLVPLPDEFYEKVGLPLPPPYKGKRYTSQSGTQIQGIVVNKRMWADAGVTQPPTTWDDFVAALKKVKAKGHAPLVYGGREWSAGQPLFYAIATNLYDLQPDPSKPSWTKRMDAGQVRFASSPVARRILERMIELLDNFVVKGALSDGYNEEQRDFYGGKGATWMMGCWLGGDIEPNKVDFEMEYWPIPSMTDRPPKFVLTSGMQNGWAITTSAKGEKLAKAQAVLDAFYDPPVYQLFLNGESQFKEARKIPIEGPKSPWPPAQRLYDNMAANLARYGTTVGFHIGLEDMPPPAFIMTLARVMQEILSGNRDVDRLLQMMDDDWASARKGM